MVWEIGQNGAKLKQVLKGHNHYVQGVAWDPVQQYVATQSSDKSCRVYALPGRSAAAEPAPSGEYAKPASRKGFTIAAQIRRRVMPLPLAEHKKQEEVAGVGELAQGPGQGQGGRELLQKHEDAASAKKSKKRKKKNKRGLFYDETVPTFVRRLCWTPDGSFLLTPTAYAKVEMAEVAMLAADAGQAGGSGADVGADAMGKGRGKAVSRMAGASACWVFLQRHVHASVFVRTHNYSITFH